MWCNARSTRSADVNTHRHTQITMSNWRILRMSGALNWVWQLGCYSYLYLSYSYSLNLSTAERQIETCHTIWYLFTFIKTHIFRKIQRIPAFKFSRKEIMVYILWSGGCFGWNFIKSERLFPLTEYLPAGSRPLWARQTRKTLVPKSLWSDSCFIGDFPKSLTFLWHPLTDTAGSRRSVAGASVSHI